MTSLAKATAVSVISCLAYRDANAAIDWLATAFGFEKHAVYKNDAGEVEHAQLTFGIGMVMIGPKRDSPYGQLIKQPDEIGGFETQSVYVVVADADAAYARAKAVGAEIAIDIKDESYGGRGFSCRHPEGHLWSFGTYDPWAK